MVNIFIVDDEPYVIEGLSIMIDWAELGVTICGTAKNGKDAYEAIRKEMPDIVITDIKMPVMTGIELIEKCAFLKSPPEFIILSGYGELEYARTAMKFGIKHFLLKPLDENEITDTVLKVKKHIESKKEIAKNTDEMLGYMAEDMIKRIINRAFSEQHLTKAAFIMDINILKKIYLVLFKVENYFVWYTKFKESGIYKYKNIIKDIVVSSLGEKFQTRLFFNTLGIFGLIVPEDEVNENINEISSYISQKINEGINSPVKAFVSNSIFLGEIGYEYVKAVTDGTASNKNERILYNISDYKLDKLAQAISDGSYDNIRDIIDRQFSEFEETGSAPVIVDGYIALIVIEISKLADRLGISVSREIDDILYSFSENGIITKKKEVCFTICNFTAEILKSPVVLGDTLFSDKIIEYINENSQKDLSLVSIGDFFMIKPSVASKVIKQKTGMKFNDFLNSERIKKAARMILYTDEKTMNIALDAGYKDYGYFVDKFKSITGYSPSEYRKKFS